MPLINLILAVIILAGVIILVVRQIKIRKLDKKIEENWKEIDRFLGKIKTETEKAEKFFKGIDEKATKLKLKIGD